jgi:hypothetical protein
VVADVVNIVVVVAVDVIVATIDLKLSFDRKLPYAERYAGVFFGQDRRSQNGRLLR